VRAVAEETAVEITTGQSIEQLKLKYKELKGCDCDALKIRLLFKGKELQNDLFVYNYEMNNDSVVQAMIPRQ
jgi:hypothetical protein